METTVRRRVQAVEQGGVKKKNEVQLDSLGKYSEVGFFGHDSWVMFLLCSVDGVDINP